MSWSVCWTLSSSPEHLSYIWHLGPNGIYNCVTYNPPPLPPQIVVAVTLLTMEWRCGKAKASARTGVISLKSQLLPELRADLICQPASRARACFLCLCIALEIAGGADLDCLRLEVVTRTPHQAQAIKEVRVKLWSCNLFCGKSLYFHLNANNTRYYLQNGNYQDILQTRDKFRALYVIIIQSHLIWWHFLSLSTHCKAVNNLNIHHLWKWSA